MLRIGEFAWLSQVTVETLRHYDRIGLLKPVHLDRFTGYRYYSLNQLPRLNRVLALKDLGLPLKEIARMLDRDVSVDEIRGILEVKEAELKEQINIEKVIVFEGEIMASTGKGMSFEFKEAGIADDGSFTIPDGAKIVSIITY